MKATAMADITDEKPYPQTLAEQMAETERHAPPAWATGKLAALVFGVMTLGALIANALSWLRG